MPKLIDITGHKYGRLMVDGISHRNARGIIVWDCTCDCGSKVKSYSNNMRSGSAISCGCYQKERVSESHTKHGMSLSLEYKIYIGIKDRCLNHKNSRYMSYGGRGITICDEWLGETGFERFIYDMGKKPFKGASIDRIDNNSGYYNGNCRWADSVTQSHNTRVRCDNTSGVKGVQFDKNRNKWQARLRYKGKQVLNEFFLEFDCAVASRKKAELLIIEANSNV